MIIIFSLISARRWMFQPNLAHPYLHSVYYTTTGPDLHLLRERGNIRNLYTGNVLPALQFGSSGSASGPERCMQAARQSIAQQWSCLQCQTAY